MGVAMDTWRIEYHFASADGHEATFALDFDAATMSPCRPLPRDVPAWARLECQQCPACRLRPETSPFCPAALCLADLLSWFSGLDSYTPIRLTVRTAERTVLADTTAQRALSSLMGLLLSTSGCPEMDFLKPMARFHLPLASETETVYRAVSMYLTAQYFVERAGRLGDFELAGLNARYRRLHDINQALSARLRQAVATDSGPNAIILLDCFAKAVPGMVDEALSELDGLFASYLVD